MNLAAELNSDYKSDNGDNMEHIDIVQTSSDHFKGCCLEMIAFLAVIYFLKTVLNFDVFSGPEHLQKLHRTRTSGARENADDTEDNVNKKAEDQSKSRSVSYSQSNNVTVESDGEEDDEYNENTVDKSYEVSAWSEEQEYLSETNSEADEVDTNITNISDESGDEIHIEEDEDISKDKDHGQDTYDSEKTSCSSDSDVEEIDGESIYTTNWYQKYEAQHQSLINPETDKR